MNRHNYNHIIFLSLYLFILIFQPQIIPINTIYILGVITLCLLAYESKGKINISIFQRSQMAYLFKVFLALSIYLVFISIIDIATGGILLIDNRIRCLNQLLVLTGIEFICLLYFFKQCQKFNLNLDDLILILGIAGALQGLCSISAYLIPQIRSFFLRYNGEVFRNSYVLERRGYGFSNILLDTYGYGMGLIAGVILLSKSIKPILKWIIILLCLVSIVLNARTGIVVFSIALILYLFRTNTLPKFLLKSLFALVILYFVFVFILPVAIDQLSVSSSINIRWAVQGISSFVSIFSDNTSLNDTVILSSFSHLPDSALTMLFGSGHNVYGISNAIGFHSDVGYINYLWEFGIIGSLFLMYSIIKLYIYCYKSANVSDKFIVVFLFASYIAVLFKGILIGYNPGVVVNYLIVFSLILYKNDNKTTILSIRSKV